MATLFIGIGSNQGDKISIIQSAIRSISEQIGKISACSSVYESEAWGYQSDNFFFNLVVSIETTENPKGVLAKLKHIETELGRLPKKGVNYEDRPIDLDILDYENHLISEKTLEIPHPKIADRLFVLLPFNEIAPNWIFKSNSQTVQSLLEKCADPTVIRKLSTVKIELLN